MTIANTVWKKVHTVRVKLGNQTKALLSDHAEFCESRQRIQPPQMKGLAIANPVWKKVPTVRLNLVT